MRLLYAFILSIALTGSASSSDTFYICKEHFDFWKQKIERADPALIQQLSDEFEGQPVPTLIIRDCKSPRRILPARSHNTLLRITDQPPLIVD